MRLLACALYAMAGAAAAADSSLPDWHPYVQARAWAAYDAIPIGELDGDWGRGFDPRKGRNVLLQRHRVEAGVESGAWRLGWEARQEATLASDRQTLVFVRDYKQRFRPPADTSYALAARLERWSAQGLRLGRWFGDADGAMPRVQLSGAFYSRASLRDTDVAGKVSYQVPDHYDFNVRRIEANSAERYPFMQDTPGGAGASMSLALAWRPAPALTVAANIDDLLSVMRFKNLPIKEDRIDSRVSTVDADGYINYQPLLSGMNRQATIRRRLGRSGAASLSYDARSVIVTAGLERLAGITIPSLALGHSFSWGTLSSRVETRFDSIGIGIQTARVTIAVQSDSARLGRARSLGASLGLRY